MVVADVTRGLVPTIQLLHTIRDREARPILKEGVDHAGRRALV
jgi:hypothetical protein